MTTDNVFDLLILLTLCYIALRLGTFSVDFKKKVKRRESDYYNMFD